MLALAASQGQLRGVHDHRCCHGDNDNDDGDDYYEYSYYCYYYSFGYYDEDDL